MKPQGINSRFSGKQRFEQSDFSGGMNTKDDPISVKENQCQRLLNLIPAIGSPIQRNGIIHSGIVRNINFLSAVKIYDDSVITFALDTETIRWRIGDTNTEFFDHTNALFATYDSDSITATSINENTFILFPGYGTYLVKPDSNGNPAAYFLNHGGFELNADSSEPGFTYTSPNPWSVQHKEWMFAETGSPGLPTTNQDLNYAYDFNIRTSSSVNSSIRGNNIDNSNQIKEKYLYCGYAIQLVNLGIAGETVVSEVFRNAIIEFPVRLDKDVRVLPFLKFPFSNVKNARNTFFADLGFIPNSGWILTDGLGLINDVDYLGYDINNIADIAYRQIGTNGLEPAYLAGAANANKYGAVGLQNYVGGGKNLGQNTPNVDIILPQIDVYLSDEYEILSAGPPITRKSGQVYINNKADGTPNARRLASDPSYFGATHIRIYRTAFQETVEGAQGGAAFRFLVDIPINESCAVFASGRYNDQTSEDSLLGSDHVLDLGFQQPPKGSVIKYSSGRLWIGGADSGESKIFYSKLPSQSSGYIVDASKFYLEENWLDIGLDSNQKILAIEDCKDALVFFGTNKAYELSQGNPFAGLRVLAENGGIMGKRALCKFESGIYYISRSGPAVIDGGKFNLLNDYAIGELFPESGIPHQRESYLANNFQGNISPSNEFYISQRTDACARSLFSKEYRKLQAWIQNDIIYTKYQYKNTEDAWEEVMFGFRLGHGAFEIGINPGYTPQIVIPITGAKSIGISQYGMFYDLFVLTTTQDKHEGVDYNFLLEFRSKRFLTNKEDQCRFGELYDAKISCRYLDTDHPKFTIIADDSWMVEDIDKLETNYSGPGAVNNRHTSDAIDFSNNHANYINDANKMRNSVMHIRNNVQLGFREGLYGQYFEIWMNKLSSNIFKFYGFDINYHIRDSAIPIFITHDTYQLDGLSVQSGTTADTGGIGFATISAFFRIGS